MNETPTFFQSWGFWLCLGLFIGAIVVFFVAAVCAASGQASRDEEWREMFFNCVDEKERLEKELLAMNKGKPDREKDAIIKDHKKCLEAKKAITAYNFPACKGKPGRE